MEFEPPPDIQRQIYEIEAQRASAPALKGGVAAVNEAAARGAQAQTSAPGDQVAVPYYDITRVTALNAFIARGEATRTVFLSMDWLAWRFGGYAENLAFIDAPLDDFRPTICKGDLLLVDMADTHVSDGYYAYAIDNWVFVSHLRRPIDTKNPVPSDKTIFVVPEAPGAEAFELPKLEDFPDPSRILGRVIAIDRHV